MCKNVCSQYKIIENQYNYYCQDCAKYISEKHITRERKTNGRRRCNCCNGLVRNKIRVFYNNKLTTT